MADVPSRRPHDRFWPIEYLAALNAAHHDEETSSDRGGKRGKPSKEVSLTDPQAAWVARKGTDRFFAYANYLIDNKAGPIVDAEGTRANRIAEIAIAETMIERVKERFNLRPHRLAGDTVYGAARLLRVAGGTQHQPTHPGLG